MEDPRDIRIAQLEARVAELIAVVQQQAVRIAELEARLKADSHTSSKPPSSDGLTKRPSVPRERGKRNPGKQPGVDGRYLMQVDEPDEVHTITPDICTGCAANLVDADVVGVERRQVADLLPIDLVWTEYRAERRQCACGLVSSAVFPRGVLAPTQYGPGLVSIAAYLCGYQHVPYNRASQLFADVLGAPVSTGWIAAAVARTADAVAPIVVWIADAISGAELAHFDETGGRVAGRLNWIHTASTKLFTHLSVQSKRGKVGIDAAGIMPNFAGIAVHDGWAAYRQYMQATHALCNAHHLRELAGVAELYEQPWATQMIELLLAIKLSVEHARDRGECSLDPELEAGYHEQYEEIVAAGHAANPPPERTGKRGRPKRSKPGNLVKRLDEHRKQTLRFMTDFRVPFDNNQAERDLRMVKLQQKTSGCWRTEDGARRYLDLRSYIATARKHGVSIIAVLRDAANGTPWHPAPTGT